MYGQVLVKPITISFDILKVVGLKVNVTDSCSDGGIPVDGSLSDTI